MNKILRTAAHVALPSETGDSVSLSRLLLAFSLLFSILLLPGQSLAHRGSANEVDDCRIRVGYEWVHFTAYTPTLTQGKEYCKVIPQLGPTNLVFDYEGKNLRHITVEFEITKEPEGTRVFYQEPQMIKTGSANGQVDFSKFGKGDYLAHVTIVHKGKTLDSHLPFQVGIEEASYGNLMKYGIAIILVILILLFMISKAKKAPPPKEELAEPDSSSQE